MLECLLPSLEKQGQWAAEIETCSLQAHALQALGRKAQAVTALGKALARAEPKGYLRLFADEGQPLIALLRQVGAQGVAPEYVGRLLDAIAEPLLAPETLKLVEPLSERELKVLRLIAAGLLLYDLPWHCIPVFLLLPARGRRGCAEQGQPTLSSVACTSLLHGSGFCAMTPSALLGRRPAVVGSERGGPADRSF